MQKYKIKSLYDNILSNIVISVYYPIKYQLRTYRDYRVLDDKATGEPGLGSALRSLILLKNRFGNANKVFPVGFQGSIGRFVELPKPEIIDYSQYQLWKDEKIEDKIIKGTENKVPVQDPSNKIFTFV